MKLIFVISIVFILTVIGLKNQVNSHPVENDVDFFIKYYSKECRSLCDECGCTGFYCGTECICECPNEPLDVVCIQNLSKKQHTYEILIQGPNGTQSASDIVDNNNVIELDSKDVEFENEFTKRSRRDTEIDETVAMKAPAAAAAVAAKTAKVSVLSKLNIPPPDTAAVKQKFEDMVVKLKEKSEAKLPKINLDEIKIKSDAVATDTSTKIQSAIKVISEKLTAAKAVKLGTLGSPGPQNSGENQPGQHGQPEHSPNDPKSPPVVQPK